MKSLLVPSGFCQLKALAQNVQDYRKDTHYSTKKGVKSAGRAVQSVRGVGWVEPISVRVRQSKCLEFIKTKKKKIAPAALLLDKYAVACVSLFPLHHNRVLTYLLISCHLLPTPPPSPANIPLICEWHVKIAHE